MKDEISVSKWWDNFINKIDDQFDGNFGIAIEESKDYEDNWKVVFMDNPPKEGKITDPLLVYYIPMKDRDEEELKLLVKRTVMAICMVQGVGHLEDYKTTKGNSHVVYNNPDKR